MWSTNPFVLFLLLLLWYSVYKVVHFLVALIFTGAGYKYLYANLIAIPWPVTVPLGLVFLLILGTWMEVKRKWRSRSQR